MTGVIYIIINQFNLKNNIKPMFYIGSKKNIEAFGTYWGSSKYLSEDINKLGIDNFAKYVLFEMEFNDVSELLEHEERLQLANDVVNSEYFYNKSLASGPFGNDDGTYIKNTIWVNNGKVNKRVDESELMKYTSKGYVRGRRDGKYMQGRKYINDGIQTKSVPKSELNKWLTDGWVVGRLSGNQQGRRWVNNHTSRKFITASEFDKYIAEGWVEGWAF